MAEIVQNDQIVAFNAMNVDFIREIPDLETAKLFVARLSGYQKALQEADRFYEMSVAFAELEAAALIRVMELTNGRQNVIKGDRGKAAHWIYLMSEDERKKTIQMCKDGLTITQVWKREVKYKDGIPLTPKEKKIHARKQEYLEEAEEVGVVDISNFSLGEDSHHQIERYMWEDAKQGLRRSLLKSGFVGVGNRLQIYVNPAKSNEDQIRMAIITRLESINNDVKNVHEIASAAGIPIPNISQLETLINETLFTFKKEG